MKKTVKFISAICAIVMLLGILPVMSVSAADAATLVVTPSKETVKKDREFTVTISIANNPGFGSIAFAMPIDPEAFEYVGYDTTGSICKNFGIIDFDTTVNKFKFNGLGTGIDDVTGDGLLVTIILKAKKTGEYAFTTEIDAKNTTGTHSGLFEVANASAAVEIVTGAPINTIASAQVNLGTDISVSYFVDLDREHRGAQMRFTFNDEEIIVDGDPSEDDVNEYKYTFTGIAPQCMGDNIKAELVLDGEVIDTKEEYSVLANCQNLLAKSAAELGLDNAQYAAMETLIADLLVYGAKAQVYRSYKTDALVDADVTGATEFVALETTDKKANATKVDGVEFVAAGVFFDYTNSIYVKFTAPDMAGSDLRITFGTQKYLLSECELIDEATSTYRAKLAPTSVLDYGTADFISIEIYDSEWDEWNAAQKLRYSVNSYVYSMQTSENPAMADLAKALYNYGVSAVAYLNA